MKKLSLLLSLGLILTGSLVGCSKKGSNTSTSVCSVCPKEKTVKIVERDLEYIFSKGVNDGYKYLVKGIKPYAFEKNPIGYSKDGYYLWFNSPDKSDYLCTMIMPQGATTITSKGNVAFVSEYIDFVRMFETEESTKTCSVTDTYDLYLFRVSSSGSSSVYAEVVDHYSAE